MMGPARYDWSQMMAMSVLVLCRYWYCSCFSKNILLRACRPEA
ncbi:hypothetical protein [Suipraeoptans intestinalis]|nr:hypothetical protein [Suipraeoptans intestinalis]